MVLRRTRSPIQQEESFIMSRNTSQLTVAQLAALIAGIQKYAANATFMVASQAITAAQAVTLFQTLHDTSAATDAAKAAWKQTLAADKVGEAQNGALAREIRDAIALMFSNAAATLQAFGLSPRKPPTPLSVAARAAANAKAKATREARGTKGSVQKAAITGNVSGVTITPIVIPAAQPTAASPPPTAPTAPAPVASSGGTVVSTASHS
jgi:hypothetical protein